VTAQNVSHGLIRQVMTEIGHRTDDAIIGLTRPRPRTSQRRGSVAVNNGGPDGANGDSLPIRLTALATATP
jgi:hypothetical protein